MNNRYQLNYSELKSTSLYDLEGNAVALLGCSLHHTENNQTKIVNKSNTNNLTISYDMISKLENSGLYLTWWDKLKIKLKARRLLWIY